MQVDKHQRNVKKIIVKKVAMLSEEPLFWETCAKNFFKIILNKYQWTKNDITYKIIIEEIYDKDILTGKLTTSKYDVLLIPGGGVGDGHSITKGFTLSPRVKKWKRKIQDFVKDGGGIIGFCGGTSLITSLTTGDRKPSTFCERRYDKSSLGIACTKSYYQYLALPLLYPFQLTHPERIGTTAYVFSFKPAKNSDGDYFHTGGVPIDIKLLKDNPIFSDYKEDTLTVRWWGGQALWPEEKPSRNVKVCAMYPEKELHEMDRTKIHAWKYTGSIPGVIRGFFKAMYFAKQQKINIFDAAMFSYYFAGNWVVTDNLIKSYLAKRPCIVIEEYPNKNNGRIVLNALHPEYMVWWDGEIKERKEEFTSLADGLYEWKNITTLKKPIDTNLTHTWWVVRRFVAWAAKIPDEHMPPIQKQNVDSNDFKLIENCIIWDGTLLNQMECI
jgi:glutamine amidotransferase-like uncharacterized protein